MSWKWASLTIFSGQVVDEMNIVFSQKDFKKLVDMQRWCYNIIGPGMVLDETPTRLESMGDISWTIAYIFGEATLSFRNEEDYSLFLLRWT